MNILITFDAATDRERCGGKSTNLSFLTRLGLNVPEGRVVPADEFSRQVASLAAGADVAAELSSRPLRPELGAELRSLVRTLGGRVSVRSSATLEDARTHSFAGQFLTVLNVGEDGVEEAVRKVWASVFGQNVRAYLRRADLDAEKLRMAVVVQRQIDSASSGVAMGRAGGVMVEAIFGQGEALVSGAIPADHWEVEGGRVASVRIATKRERVGLPGAADGSLERVALDGKTQNKPSLSDAQVLEVAAACERVAAACEGRAQDCEFAYADGRLHLLQTRDVTASLPVSAPPMPAFAAPGKGAWELDASHFQRPCTPMFQAVFPGAMAAGFSRALERYGALVSHIDYRFVNGFAYSRLRLVAAPEDATARPSPPAWLFKLLCKILPALRSRVQQAAAAYAGREWDRHAAEWKTARARSVEAHLRLQSVALDTLDDAGLAAHFDEVLAHVGAMIEQHHSFNMTALLPVGDLLVHVAAWSGGKVSDAEVFTLLTGASPVTADLTSDEARQMGAALANHDTASRLLRLSSTDAAISDTAAQEALDAMRALGGEAGERTRRFLAMREFRLVDGLDPGAPCLRECPALLWQALRTAALQGSATQTAKGADAQALATLRAAISADKHPALDVLIADARAVVSLRDERALFSDVWAWGILRTTVLAIGRRLIQRSPKLLCVPSDLLQAAPDELRSLLARSEGPGAIELEQRAAYFRAYTTRDAPTTLGMKPLPPPSAEAFPPAAARVMAGLLRVMPHVIAPSAERTDGAGMRGSPASGGVWEGPAHIVNSHDDAKDIPVGAVLVVGTGSSSFTMLAPLASAVVAEGGGLLSHVAIVCREYRIPCVTGVPGVLGSLRHGQRLRVDGTRGTVEALAG